MHLNQAGLKARLYGSWSINSGSGGPSGPPTIAGARFEDLSRVPNRPPRAPGFSYVGLQLYFLTICCDQRRPDFEDDHPAAWVASEILQIFPSEQFAVVAYCVMPDHVHLLLEGSTEDADLRAAMQIWKQRTSFEWKRRCGRRLWQSGYYDYVLRDEDSVPAIVKYIIGNPVRAGLVADASQYPHVGSSRYRFEELADGVIDWRPGVRRA